MGEVLFPILGFLLNFALTWWWIFLPFLLFPFLKEIYVFWREELWDESLPPYLFLKIKVPSDSPKPFKAMENVYASLWQVHDPPNPREKWIDGEYQLSVSVEMVSREGQVNFYLRVPRAIRHLVESAVYAQYPEVELEEAEDFTKVLPPDIPNKEWDLWGTNYILGKPDVYPIKTYVDFFEERASDKEEERIDPMALLMESLSRLGKDEHMWIQFVLKPVTQDEDNYYERGKELMTKLTGRTLPAKPTTLIDDVKKASTAVVTGNFDPEGKEAERQAFIPELQLTGGERDIISAIERKIGKFGFVVFARFMYIAKRDVYSSPAKTLAMAYFTQFSTQSLNTFRPLTSTLTKSYTFKRALFDKRISYMKKRHMMRSFIAHLPPFFPKHGGTFFLNIEELATIFHFPGKLIGTAAAESIPSKRGEAPPELPVE